MASRFKKKLPVWVERSGKNPYTTGVVDVFCLSMERLFGPVFPRPNGGFRPFRHGSPTGPGKGFPALKNWQTLYGRGCVSAGPKIRGYRNRPIRRHKKGAVPGKGRRQIVAMKRRSFSFERSRRRIPRQTRLGPPLPRQEKSFSLNNCMKKRRHFKGNPRRHSLRGKGLSYRRFRRPRP